ANRKTSAGLERPVRRSRASAVQRAAPVATTASAWVAMRRGMRSSPPLECVPMVPILYAVFIGIAEARSHSLIDSRARFGAEAARDEGAASGPPDQRERRVAMTTPLLIPAIAAAIVLFILL